MRRVVAMAIKDLTLISRDWLGMFFIVGFPVCMAILFGAIMGDMSRGGGGPITVAIADEDNSAMSKNFMEAIQKNEKIKVVAMPREEAADRVRRGGMLGLIVLTEGFGDTAGIMWQNPPTIILGLDPSRQA